MNSTGPGDLRAFGSSGLRDRGRTQLSRRVSAASSSLRYRARIPSERKRLSGGRPPKSESAQNASNAVQSSTTEIPAHFARAAEVVGFGSMDQSRTKSPDYRSLSARVSSRTSGRD